ncbi:TIGR03790 family protein, partial [bacterium]|nr:TIGR03790 family protein [bacterium]
KGALEHTLKEQRGDISPDICSPDQVLVIVNQNSEVSLAIGNYYMEIRGIPEGNLCLISSSTNEVIQRFEYISNIFLPVKDYLESTGLKERIKYLVTTTGVPLKITGEFSFDTYMASVDSELVLLDYDTYNLRGWLRNPYFGADSNLDRSTIPIYLVNRLTAYDIDEDSNNIPDDVESYLQKSLYPPSDEGRFVLDVDPGRDNMGGYGVANDWLREAANTLTQMGADVFLDETNDFLVNEENVAGYCSWGSNDTHTKNHGEPYFTWVDGAIAATYVSTNARTFKYPPNYGQSMEADMLREGVTGVYGNVYEPYLDACARPHVLFPRYYIGYNLAESYYMSLFYISWMEIVVGDPLCAPYAERIPRVYITTNQIKYSSDDSLKVDVDLWNTGNQIPVKLYVAISINNKLNFYPDWSMKPDYREFQLDEKSRLHLDILDLDLFGITVPIDAVFYAAITDSEGNLIGRLSYAAIELK